MRIALVISLTALTLTNSQLIYEYTHPSFEPVNRVKRDFKQSEWDEHLPKDVEEEKPDSSTNHTYYKMDIFSNRTDLMSQYYLDVKEWLKSSSPGVNGTENHEHLDGSYRKAAGANIGFKFPFYGHEIENLTVATGGFCYVGDQTHSWLAATQYIAPLMANFDTMSNSSVIMHASNSSRMVITWENVALRDNAKAGNWTFQVSLFSNGDIWFVYKDIPIPVSQISDNNHPCKLGISDAYLFVHQYSEGAPIQTKKVIHEYHRIVVPIEKIVNNTVVVLKALPTCLQFKNCGDCSTIKIDNFNCSWCAPKQSDVEPFCSDFAGLHRRRQHWVEGDCARMPGPDQCKATTTTSLSTTTPETVTAPEADLEQYKLKQLDHQVRRSGGFGRILLAVFILFLISSCVWIVYAFYNPHTPSGQLLIKYRPSKWQIPSSHVRYSASVHM
ncbi:unnamed protein product [Bursaphelenchus okinawaensis]|uniref:PSI domain-containing protein n=1 Tax=Bursaphelenchus okinawaensis TaxID=465554 RepID=A0A811KJ20_9BILA|nr:unnamed protein product [Bursaphelenchus okinawaensis]CAG9103839.1 unnamed protein product [Bursaphelenchus okinawaensis]